MTGEMIFQIIIQHVESELFVSLKLLHESWSILNYLETHQSWIPDSISTLAKWSDIEILGFSDSTTTSFNRLIHDQQFPNLFSRYVFFSPEESSSATAEIERILPLETISVLYSHIIMYSMCTEVVETYTSPGKKSMFVSRKPYEREEGKPSADYVSLPSYE